MRAFRVPHVVGDLAKDAVANHHPRATWLVMIEPDESRVAVSGVEIGPVARENVRVEIDLHGWSRAVNLVDASDQKAAQMQKKKSADGAADPRLKRFYRLRLRDFSAALLAGAPRIVVPKIEHRLAEVFDDVAAVEIDVFH
jgi:hypothetical protein